MSKITLKQAAAWCGGFVEEKYENVEFLGASNDTRLLQKGQCFITLSLTAYPVARCYDNMNFSADGFQYVGAVLRKKSGKLLFRRARLTFTMLLQRGHLHSTVPVAMDVL